MNQRTSLSGISLLLGAATSYASTSLFVTWLATDGVEPWFQITARLILAVVILFFLMICFRRNPIRGASQRKLFFLAMNGLLMLAGSSFYIFAISLGTPPTKVVLLAYLSPIYVALLGTKILGERLTRNKLFAIAIGLFGLAFTLKIWDGVALSGFQLGDLLACAIGLIIAGQLLLARWSGIQEKTHPLTFTFWSLLLSLGWLVLFCLVALLWRGPTTLLALVPTPLSPRIAANVVGLTVPGTILAYWLLYMGLERSEAGVASVVLLFEPVCIFIFSFVFLHQPIGWWQFVGGGAILTAGALVAR